MTSMVDEFTDYQVRANASSPKRVDVDVDGLKSRCSAALQYLMSSRLKVKVRRVGRANIIRELQETPLKTSLLGTQTQEAWSWSEFSDDRKGFSYLYRHGLGWQ